MLWYALEQCKNLIENIRFLLDKILKFTNQNLGRCKLIESYNKNSHVKHCFWAFHSLRWQKWKWFPTTYESYWVSVWTSLRATKNENDSESTQKYGVMMKLKNKRETWMDSASVAESVSKKNSKRNFGGQVVKHILHLPVI